MADRRSARTFAQLFTMLASDELDSDIAGLCGLAHTSTKHTASVILDFKRSLARRLWVMAQELDLDPPMDCDTALVYLGLARQSGLDGGYDYGPVG